MPSSPTWKRQKAALLLARRRLTQSKNQTTPLDLLTWTLLHRRRLDPKTLFNLTKHLYLAGIYTDTSQEIVVVKPGQMGLSEWLISYVLHGCDQRQLTALYVMPTDADVSDFSQARFGPAIEASPYLSNLIVDHNTDRTKRGADKVSLKRIRDSFLYLRGGRVHSDGKSHREGQARQLKSIPADILCLDELDEIDPRAPEIARKRLGHSPVAEVRQVSTPTYPGYGIDAAFEPTNQCRWHIPCPHCHTWQHLTLNHLILESDDLGRPTAWHGQADGDDPLGRPYLACQHCGRPLDRLAPGRWQATYPDRSIAGYHLTKLFSSLYSLTDLLEALSQTDETKRKETFNQDLGLPYLPKGGRMTVETLDACRRDYGHGPHFVKTIEQGREIKTPEKTCMGADIGSIIYAVIRAPRQPDGSRPQRWAGEADSFTTLGILMRQYHVASLVIDALPETRKCRELQAAFPDYLVWLAYFSEEEDRNTEAIRWDYKKKMFSSIALAFSTRATPDFTTIPPFIPCPSTFGPPPTTTAT